MPYEIINDPDQIKLQVNSVALEDFFIDAFTGTMELLNGSIADVSDDDVVHHISLKSDDLNELLVDFLNEILFLCRENNEIYSEVEFTSLEEDNLEAVITGTKIENFAEDIKSVSYFEDEDGEDIHDDQGDWQAVLLFE